MQEWLEVPVSLVTLTEVLEKSREGVGHAECHMRKLSGYGLLKLKSTRPVRGAVEHFYVLP